MTGDKQPYGCGNGGLTLGKGNPRCEACHGRGGWRGPNGWIKCACVVATATQRDLVRYMHSIGTNTQISLFDDEGND